MKQLLFSVAVLFALSFSAEAQTVKTLKSTWGTVEASGVAFDTIKTTTALYMYTGSVKGMNVVNIVAKATELSGTTSGTLTLEASLDGTTWYPYYDSKDSVYSKTLADVTGAQVYRWQITNGTDNYYRVRGIGGGTVSVRFEGTYNAFIRKN